MSNVQQKLLDNWYEDVIYLENYSYDTALIGVSNKNQVVYDYEKMIEWLVETQSFSYEEAIEWIDYNTARALSYMGNNAPIIVYPLMD